MIKLNCSYCGVTKPQTGNGKWIFLSADDGTSKFFLFCTGTHEEKFIAERVGRSDTSGERETNTKASQL